MGAESTPIPASRPGGNAQSGCRGSDASSSGVGAASYVVMRHSWPFLFLFSTNRGKAAESTKAMSDSIQFDKPGNVRGLTPLFDNKAFPGVYNSHPQGGAVHAHPGNANNGGELRRGPAGGELKDRTILDRAGGLAKPNYTDLSKTYYRGE
jgi:hypothetical protein